MVSAGVFLNQVTRSPCSFCNLTESGCPAVWQFMQRKRIAQMFCSNDSNKRSLRACRTISTGFSGPPSSSCVSFGIFINASSLQQALIHSENAFSSSSRVFAIIILGLELGSFIEMNLRIRDFSGSFISTKP